MEVDWAADILRHLMVWRLKVFGCFSVFCDPVRIEIVNPDRVLLWCTVVGGKERIVHLVSSKLEL